MQSGNVGNQSLDFLRRLNRPTAVIWITDDVARSCLMSVVSNS
jgi:hypothetical protein